ncbi:serine/threonine-protein kinase RUNKEL-like [Impatiens glandulifera]|uniref:serine/threonine-protein kinase RUNKEL-like n=1 Tax=Impatiens glandulifera TaxID=253017 RepID=UPI001FB0699C|nr:serine/threonine-protein kinase RUNKEL-like [Impatiens glandulifera]
MNHYHIFEAIGRGKYSTVYKGRKKKTLEYFAIKSVDKSQKSKVLQEVRNLHTLDHPNILKFYSWYETSAHLWLVLEYCVGGDLMSLLKQDKQLPEDSIHIFACDLVKALMYLHSKGIIYCDLKPSNILLDENSHTKLCDFGLARKLSDVSDTTSSMTPQSKRGTPFYMAPELFQEGGVHSYASDFWALGCVLYEFYTGAPPFVGKEFTQLVKSILSDPTPSLPGTPSRPFANLINSLLVKDPAERIQWPELCGHSFWKTSFTIIPLPPQPAFDTMIEVLSRPCLVERNNNKPVQNKTLPKNSEIDSRGPPKQDGNNNLGQKGCETPVKGVTSSRRNQTKAVGKVTERQTDFSSNAKGINLLRLSRIAKSNLQRENEKENYRRPMANDCENDAEVKIENTDMELDFGENVEDETQDDTDNSACLDDKISQKNQHHGNMDEVENYTDQQDASSAIHGPVDDDSQTSTIESSSEHDNVASAPPIASPQLKTPRTKEVPGCILDVDSSKSSGEVSQVLWHPSDLSVRPVMPIKKADKILISIQSLPFEAIQAPDFVKMPKDQLDVLNNKIISNLCGNSAIGEKQNIIGYLEMLSNNAEAANSLTNGPIMLMLVKMSRQSKTSALRVQIVSLIGLLIRHCTFIDDDLANSGILGSLTDGLRDKQEKVRRSSMAALGELLFYISTQNDPTKDINPTESPAKDSRQSSGWQVSNAQISLVTSILRKGEDSLAQLYALRTIENMCSQGAHWTARFTSQDVINNLCYIFRAPGKQESTRLTAGSCLVRLVRFNPPSIQHVMEKLPLKDVASILIRGSQREQHICLNLINMALFSSHTVTNLGKHILSLAEEKGLVPLLMSLTDQGSEVLKGKSLVLVGLLCKNSRRWLAQFFSNGRLLSTMDRMGKDKDNFVQQCLQAFIDVMASILPSLLEAITADIQQMMGGRRYTQIAGLISRATPRNNVHLFPVLLHLLGSASFKRKMVSHQVLQQLANLTKLAETPFQGRDDFQITLLRVLECITEDPSFIVDRPEIFSHEILPSLAVLYKGNKDGNARFLCLKIIFDVMVIFLDEPSNDEKLQEELKSIANIHFLPLYPRFIEDEDPIPMYAQKLLVMLIECNYIKILDILHLKIVSQCFEFLLGDLSAANVNNVMLCLALASAPELENKKLSQLKVVRRIGNLLEFAYAKEMEGFIEPTLSLCRAFLLRAIGNVKGFVYAKEPNLLSDGYSDWSSVVDQQQCIKDIVDFGNNVGVLLELSKSRETNISDIASECIVLLLKVAPREATTGFLNKLPKVTIILESWQNGVSHMVLNRILHALGYSCRQYLSHAMILSISLPEILRLEAIVSQLKNVSLNGIADAACRVNIELQRLPRRV